MTIWNSLDHLIINLADGFQIKTKLFELRHMHHVLWWTDTPEYQVLFSFLLNDRDKKKSVYKIK